MIKTEDIKRLLDRYYDGTTTEEEENTLRTYFNGSDIDASLREESVFFTALQSSECPIPAGMEGRLSRQISQWNNIEVATQRTIRHINLALGSRDSSQSVAPLRYWSYRLPKREQLSTDRTGHLY